MASAKKSSAPFDGKVMRFFTSIALPVDPNRTGDCRNCGACCKFMVRCPFLKYVDGDAASSRCRIYRLRPLQCRKYPRTRSEQIHQPCGYCFKDEPPGESG